MKRDTSTCHSVFNTQRRTEIAKFIKVRARNELTLRNSSDARTRQGFAQAAFAAATR